MADLLNLAREKSDRLLRQAEESAALVEAGDFFFHGILNMRDVLSKEVEDFDDFLSSADAIVHVLRGMSEKNMEEVNKIQAFIALGQKLLRSAVEAGDP